MKETEVEGPIVELVDYTSSAFDLSIATARTCYSAKGIITPEQVGATEKSRALRDRIAASTLKAGHLTTRQHPNFIFTIDRASRHLIWSFLHSHPYYNSEQVSQRYVEVKAESFHVPAGLKETGREGARESYLETVRFATDAYFELIEALTPVCREEYFRVFPGRGKQPEKWEKAIHKKAMEAARYVLPVSTHAYLYHTINGLTLHRYHRLANAFDVPEETRQLVEAMFEAVKAVEPDYVNEMMDPLPLEETQEFKFFEEFYGTREGRVRWNKEQAKAFVAEFDQELGGKRARLCGVNEQAVENLAASVRSVLGLPASAMSTEDAVGLALNPARNTHLQSTLNETTLTKISRALYNVHYTFQKKISHTADSQDQRHRMVPGARPVLMSHYTGEADYITPLVVEKAEAVFSIYKKRMEEIFARINTFLERDGFMEEAVYLLPNAFPVRFYESGDLLNLHHKWRSRLCYNAQEEIFYASLDETIQVEEQHAEIGRWIKAPCWIRKQAGAKPFCPEGDHYCGVPVWNKELSEYERVL